MNKDFNNNMNQLIDLLKKILGHIPSQKIGDPFYSAEQDKSTVNLNLCFFNFLPLSMEEFENLEEAYDDFLSTYEDKKGGSETALTEADKEFLRRHGIRF